MRPCGFCGEMIEQEGSGIKFGVGTGKPHICPSPTKVPEKLNEDPSKETEPDGYPLMHQTALLQNRLKINEIIDFLQQKEEKDG